MRPVDSRVGFSTMVGDEQESIPSLLDLVLPLFDEVIVYCTGCKDATWDILRKYEVGYPDKFRAYLQRIPFDAQHFHFGYTRSIAAHLNSCGYVLMLDADERMSAASLHNIRHMYVPEMKDKDWYAAAFPRHNWYCGPEEQGKYSIEAYPDWQTRLIKNDGQVWWRRPVHEACLYGPQGLQINAIGVQEIHIEHYHDYYYNLNKKSTPHISYLQLADSDPEWAESYPKNMRMNNDPERLAAITQIYNDLLGREPDPNGLAAWASTEYSTDEIRKHISLSDEYKARKCNQNTQ